MSDKQHVIAAIEQQLIALRRTGISHLPRDWDQAIRDSLQAGKNQTKPTNRAVQPQSPVDSVAEPSASVAKTPAAEVPVMTKPPASSITSLTEPYPEKTPLSERPAALTVIQNEVAQCVRCPELVRNRTQTVFGVGNTSPRICFLGEGPGADEDKQGVPFVGAAGQLLDKIIAASTLKRGDVYILNVVKCRPPQNRNPSDSEMANCFGYAERQLAILQPEFIVCLGAIACRALLGPKASISKLRGSFHTYRGSRVIVTYHPAYLLRNPDAKKHVWTDMKMLMKELGVEL